MFHERDDSHVKLRILGFIQQFENYLFEHLCRLKSLTENVGMFLTEQRGVTLTCKEMTLSIFKIDETLIKALLNKEIKICYRINAAWMQ